MIKSYLSDKGIKYEVKMADEDQAIAKELYAKSGQLGVPFTVISDDDGKEELILGFDRQKIDAALSL
jgi:glutaredoxin